MQTCEMLKHHRWSIISERKKEKKICSSFRQWDWQSLYPITALLKRKRYSCILKSFFTFSICDGLKKTQLWSSEQNKQGTAATSTDPHRTRLHGSRCFIIQPQSQHFSIYLFSFFLSSWPLTFTWAESRKDLELDLSHFSLASHLCRNNDYSTR